MNQTRRTILSALLALAVAAAPAWAQRAPITSEADMELEKLAGHNLDVGRQYLKRKAYAGAKDRLEEVVATYPEFSKIDEVYYLLGLCYVRTKENDLARETFQRLVDERPESDFAKKARAELEKIPD